MKILNYSSNLSLLLSNKIALKKDGNTSVVHGKTEQQLISRGLYTNGKYNESFVLIFILNIEVNTLKQYGIS